MQARIAVAVVGALTVLSLAGQSVYADGGAPGTGSTGASCPPGSTTCTVSAGTGGSQGSPGAPAASGVACTWQAISAEIALAEMTGHIPGSIPASSGMGGVSLVEYGPPGPNDTWYLVLCGANSGFVAEVAPGGGGGPTPAQVGQLAVSQLNLIGPSVSMAPPTSQGAVVNLKSWLWVAPSSWHPITATATVGGIAATATATPDYVIWKMGDGQQVTCDGPGTPYNPSIPDQQQSTTCGYTYQQTSASEPGQEYAVTTTVYWHVTWTSVGVPGGGDLGVIPGRSTTTPLVVDEIGSVVVGQ